ncbi:hypothetical protein, partial [Streptomyces calidiresistens]|uniref:hypothetical protein n=1 Tax=Streptomyces calidiresistens TaxID=1485586 RepID=UPI0015F8C554
PRHAPGRRATLTQYAGAHVVIADGGSTIYEAMALGLPVVLPAWLTAARNLARAGGTLLEATVYRERLGVHVDAPSALEDACITAHETGLEERERAFIEDVLPTFYRGASGAGFAKFLLTLLEGS